MDRKLLTSVLNFLAGLGGNLLAGWVQNDILHNLFSPLSIAATVVAVLLALTLGALFEAQNAPSEKLNTAPYCNIPRSQSFKLENIPWGWLLGSLLLNILVGLSFKGFWDLAFPYVIEESIVKTFYNPILPLSIGTLWVWQKHWVEPNTKVQAAALVSAYLGGLIVVSILKAGYSMDKAIRHDDELFAPWAISIMGTFLINQCTAAIPESVRSQLFQNYGKARGFSIILTITLLGLSLGWLIRGV
ncbi:MAG: hypothetical protein HY785_29390 [Oscillatoriophycideae cyanobacterium NC_groundwater_1537_Pr4_S-0.65um_50_18]|nr:hypothetical protein [Oscillatoriophycideae cyanobacterium NC_groundwater_1537_Pr4_S-0.65um_50_18]